MQFTMNPSPSGSPDAASSVAVAPSAADAPILVNDFVTTGNTLSQLQKFFEYHTFDTSGPYSDLFSVLLSCCKHLVDTNLQHHAALSDQQRGMTRLSVGTQHVPRGKSEGVALDSMEEVRRDVRELQTAVVDLRRRQENIERHQLEECRQHEGRGGRGRIEKVRQLEEDMDRLKRGISAPTENVDREVVAPKNTVNALISNSSPVVVDSGLRDYTDRKVDALRNELCVALKEAAVEEDMNDVNSFVSHPSKSHHSVGATKHNVKVSNSRESEGDARRDSVAAGLRQLISETSKNFSERIEQLESRVEVLEVYAPHHSAMATRPPLLGVELRDEKGIGVRIDKVFRGFAGETAGMMPGDVVVAVNGQAVLTRAEMYALLTETVREYQCRCRLLKTLYFKQQVGMDKNIAGSEEMMRTGVQIDGPWKLPQLELKFHLNRGEIMRETIITVEPNYDIL